MTASVIMPNQESKNSDLDSILKALQIAATGYGIYADTKKIDLMKSQQQREEKESDAKAAEALRKSQGIYNVGDLNNFQAEGGVVSLTPPQQGLAGTFKAKVQSGPGGLQDVYLTPKPALDRGIAETHRTEDKTDTANKTDNQHAFEVDQKQTDRLFNIVNSFKEKPTVQDTKSKYDSATTALELLRNGQNAPNLDKLAYRAVFGAMERGVFRAEDAQDYGLPVGFFDRLQAQFHKNADNIELQPAERKALMSFMEQMKNKQADKMHSYAISEAKNAAAFVKGVDSAQVYNMLSPDDILNSYNNAKIDLNGSSRQQESAPRIGVSSPQMLQQSQQTTVPGYSIDDINAELNKRGVK